MYESLSLLPVSESEMFEMRFFLFHNTGSNLSAKM